MCKCECGSGLKKYACCWRIIQRQSAAKTAEALMRSRYCAYQSSDADYLLSSWHLSTRPPMLDLSEPVDWLALHIKKTQAGEPGDKEGWVEFIASYKVGGCFAQIHELSYFIFEQDRWFYVDGELKEAILPGRNSPCPCGRGLKFKRCCGV